MTGEKKDLYNLADGWLELESDPGLFTLLMEDMGVQGVQVHNINSTHGGYGSTGSTGTGYSLYSWRIWELREYRYIIFTLLMEDMGVQGVQVHDIHSTHGGYGIKGNTLKESIKCRFLNLLIMECCRYFVFSLKIIMELFKTIPAYFMAFFILQ